MIRQPPDRLPRKVLYGELAVGRRTVGGQKKRIKDHIKRSLLKFNMNPSSMEQEAADRAGWRTTLKDGAVHFGAAYDAAADERRARRHGQVVGAFICDICRRGCASLAGLRSHQRAHQRR